MPYQRFFYSSIKSNAGLVHSPIYKSCEKKQPFLCIWHGSIVFILFADSILKSTHKSVTGRQLCRISFRGGAFYVSTLHHWITENFPFSRILFKHFRRVILISFSKTSLYNYKVKPSMPGNLQRSIYFCSVCLQIKLKRKDQPLRIES